ncbi:MAG: DUF1553 domain-containing protein, partial [Alphaproteobacteria bacterium]|nr:DUF1553 domain-containing protein [Alphaproteobacteria bacterium]
AWAYRDYVIRAFNHDLPYHQFVLEQMAADRMPWRDPGALAALGFLTLGQRFINSRPDIIDDRIDVVTRGILGLTASCARCHDHKYDPVSMGEYYALYGVFDNSIEPRVPPVAARDSDLPDGYLREFQEKQRKFEEYLRTKRDQLRTSFLERAEEYFLAAQAEKVQPNFLPVMFLIDARKDLNPVMIHRLALFLAATREGQHPLMNLWHETAGLPESEFESRSLGVAEKWAASSPTTMGVVLAAWRKEQPRRLANAARVFGDLLRQADPRLPGRDSAASQPGPEWAAFEPLLRGPQAPFEVPWDDLEDYLYVDATTQNEYHEQQRAIEDWISSKGLAPHAHVLQEAAVIREPRIFRRGNASEPGSLSPRRFLSALSRGTPVGLDRGSGRLELAQALVDRSNPLTARVMANRVWLHHFGAGLVRTPGDFGTRGDPPTHRELLDHLAGRLMDSGWSIKSLHRAMVLSATYRQSSFESKAALERDPANRLFGRMNRRRLDWEAMRDSLLAVASNLEDRMGGPSVILSGNKPARRRAVYGRIDRQNVPGVFRAFDFAAPDACSAQRHQTSGAPQSLFLMNHPFVREQAQSLARRIAQESG